MFCSYSLEMNMSVDPFHPQPNDPPNLKRDAAGEEIDVSERFRILARTWTNRPLTILDLFEFAREFLQLNNPDDNAVFWTTLSNLLHGRHQGRCTPGDYAFAAGLNLLDYYSRFVFEFVDNGYTDTGETRGRVLHYRLNVTRSAQCLAGVSIPAELIGAIQLDFEKKKPFHLQTVVFNLNTLNVVEIKRIALCHPGYTVFHNVSAPIHMSGVHQLYLKDLLDQLLVFAGEECAKRYDFFLHYIFDHLENNPDEELSATVMISRAAIGGQNATDGDVIQFEVQVGEHPVPTGHLFTLATFRRTLKRLDTV